MTPTTLRRALLLSLVLAALAMAGCASYDVRAQAATHGTVTVSWAFEQEFPDGGRVTGGAGGEFGWVVQERAIRKNPVGAATGAAKKVFEMLGR